MTFKKNNGSLAEQAATAEVQEVHQNSTARMERYALLAAKSIFNFDEAVLFLSMKKSYLYKLTSRNEIPFYRPNGKLLYFEKADLEKWLRNNRVPSAAEVAEKAATMKEGGSL